MRIISLLFLLVGLSSFIQGQSFNPCLQANDIRVVVIGSSTAAGAGASPSDSSWVNRYRFYLQNINPQNEVINLAVGGYTTYKLMPSSFVPPSGRPAPDTLKNITKAISYDPDAIIINLPSNDNAQGFSIEEQLNNFDSMVSYAQSAGIPVWVCTTQPCRLQQSFAQYQMAVRDSLLNTFGSFCINFFDPIADSNGFIDTIYDSGDHVHVNNSGHYLLFNQVVQVNIPDLLFTPKISPDLTPFNYKVSENICGSSNFSVRFYFTNLGINDSSTVNAIFRAWRNGPIVSAQQLNTTMTNSCMIDSVDFLLNTSAGGVFDIQCVIQSANDTHAYNDTINLSVNLFPEAEFTPLNNTVCEGELAFFSVNPLHSDTILWYYSPQHFIPFHGGTALFTNPLIQNDTVYAQAVVGPLTNLAELSTPLSSNINWNGVMFDLYATDTLTLDSIWCRFFDAGNQDVTIMIKSGSYLGYEQQASAWTQHFNGSINVPAEYSLVNLPISPLEFLPGDTIGFYVYCNTSNSRLCYKNVGTSAVIFDEGRLHFKGGTGVAHTYGNTYFARQFCGSFHFHYGKNYQGTCHSDLKAVVCNVSQPLVDLGGDTILANVPPHYLDAGQGFATYLWSTGDTTQGIWVSDTGSVFPIWVRVTNQYNCSTSDTVWNIIFTSLEEYAVENCIMVYPNPFTEQFSIRINNLDDASFIRIVNMEGKLIFEKKMKPEKYIYNFSAGFDPAIYFVEILDSKGRSIARTSLLAQ